MGGRLREEFRTTGNGVLQKRKYVYKLSNQKELEVYRALADAPCICELHGFGCAAAATRILAGTRHDLLASVLPS